MVFTSPWCTLKLFFKSCLTGPFLVFSHFVPYRAFSILPLHQHSSGIHCIAKFLPIHSRALPLLKCLSEVQLSVSESAHTSYDNVFFRLWLCHLPQNHWCRVKCISIRHPQQTPASLSMLHLCDVNRATYHPILFIWEQHQLAFSRYQCDLSLRRSRFNLIDITLELTLQELLQWSIQTFAVK